MYKTLLEHKIIWNKKLLQQYIYNGPSHQAEHNSSTSAIFINIQLKEVHKLNWLRTSCTKITLTGIKTLKA